MAADSIDTSLPSATTNTSASSFLNSSNVNHMLSNTTKNCEEATSSENSTTTLAKLFNTIKGVTPLQALTTISYITLIQIATCSVMLFMNRKNTRIFWLITGYIVLLLCFKALILWAIVLLRAEPQQHSAATEAVASTKED